MKRRSNTIYEGSPISIMSSIKLATGWQKNEDVNVMNGEIFDSRTNATKLFYLNIASFILLI
jgi:hypothetical protein